MIEVVFLVEYDTDSEEEARAFAMHDAARMFQQDRVLAVESDLKRPKLPITEMYLDGQMDVDECIAEVEAERDG